MPATLRSNLDRFQSKVWLDTPRERCVSSKPEALSESRLRIDDLLMRFALYSRDRKDAAKRGSYSPSDMHWTIKPGAVQMGGFIPLPDTVHRLADN